MLVKEAFLKSFTGLQSTELVLVTEALLSSQPLGSVYFVCFVATEGRRAETDIVSRDQFPMSHSQLNCEKHLNMEFLCSSNSSGVSGLKKVDSGGQC